MAYSTKLFNHLAVFGARPLRKATIKNIKTPPYITADPSVRFVDLQPIWDQKPVVMVYSDGVNNLVNRCPHLHPRRPRHLMVPGTVAVLLQDEVDDSVPALLGHQIDLRWSQGLDNRAVDVLGNLIGGTDTQILSQVLDQDLLIGCTSSPRLHIDDTSILLAFLTSDSPSSCS